jgi:hypothetical protein
MKLETAIIATVVLLLLVTFVPTVLAHFRPAKVPEIEAYAAKTMDAMAVLKKVLHQTPDAAEYTDEEIVTYVGGASSRSVNLELVRDSMPLTAAEVTEGTVRFVGDGSYDVVKTGALLHDEFEIDPITTGTSDVLGYRGRQANKYLEARVDVFRKMSKYCTVRVRTPNETMRSHDLSSAEVPIVPEICKHAPMQAVSLTFTTSGTGTGGVSLFVLPHKNDLPPAAFHVRFYGNDVLIKYHVLKAATGLEPNAIVTMSAAATSRTGGEIFLMDARTGTDDVTVYAELTKGHIRLCADETARKRSYYLKLPLMFSEDSIFLSDSIDPPSVFTRTYSVEQAIVLPFAVGDMTAFDRVQATASKRTVQTPPYVPSKKKEESPADLAALEPVISASFVPEYGSLTELFGGGFARSKPGLYASNGGYIGHNETRTKSGAVIRGEWIQFDAGRPVTFQKLKYTVGFADVLRRVVVLGSNNDGWTQISVENRTPVKHTDVAIPLTGTYQQYRVIATDIAEETTNLAQEGQSFDHVGDVRMARTTTGSRRSLLVPAGARKNGSVETRTPEQKRCARL